MAWDAGIVTARRRAVVINCGNRWTPESLE
jgi:hypothetical protein